MGQSVRVPERSLGSSAGGNPSGDYVWYGIRGFALISSGGGGGLVARSLDSHEVRFERSSASAMYGTPEVIGSRLHPADLGVERPSINSEPRRQATSLTGCPLRTGVGSDSYESERVRLW